MRSSIWPRFLGQGELKNTIHEPTHSIKVFVEPWQTGASNRLLQNCLMILISHTNTVTFSVVSHCQSKLVCKFVTALAAQRVALIARVVVTSNVPVLDQFSDLLGIAQSYPFEVQLIENSNPNGFGANHNQAFNLARDHFSLKDTDIFCVVNPDIEVFDPGLLPALHKALLKTTVGLAYPVQIGGDGKALDYERPLPSPRAIFLRQLARHSGWRLKDERSATDWVSGAFMAFRVGVYAELGGFDERYFMYCEDVDLCLRAQLAGYQLARADATVIHHTQRRTLKSLQHLSWHVQSLFRLWRSNAYHQYVKLRQ